MVSAAHVSRFPRHTPTIHNDVEAPNPFSREGVMVSPSLRTQQQVISKRGRVEASVVPVFVREALDEILAHIERHHVEVQGPPFCNCDPRPAHEVDVEVGWPVTRASAGGRISIGSLPRGLARRGNVHSDGSAPIPVYS